MTDPTIHPDLGNTGVASPSGGGFIGSFDRNGGEPIWSDSIGGADWSSAGAIRYELWNFLANGDASNFANKGNYFQIIGTSGKIILDVDFASFVGNNIAGNWNEIEALLDTSAPWFFAASTSLTSSSTTLATDAQIQDVLSSVQTIGIKPESGNGRNWTGSTSNALNVERYAIDGVRIVSCVSSVVIEAEDDGPASVVSADGGTISNVVENDTLNGTTDPAIGTDVTLAVSGTAQDTTTALGLDTTPATGSITLDASTGVVTIAEDTTPGTYFYTYEICEVGNATNCSTATVEIEVTATTIAAEDDGPASVVSADGGTISNVVENDTLNGTTDPAIGTDVTLAVSGTAQDTTTALGLDTTPATGSITLDASTGVVTIAEDTTPGTYFYTYEICEVGNATNCSTATVEIEVTATTIAAEDDGPASVVSADGGTISNVVENDTLNGTTDPAIGTDVTLAVSGTAQDTTTALGLDTTPATGSITLDASTGVVTIAEDTTPGTYFYTYEICEVGNATNCSTATVEIEVTATTIAAEDDGPASVVSADGGTISNVVENDTLNGTTDPAIGTDVTLAVSGTAQDTTTALGLDTTPATGSITLDASTGVVTIAEDTTPGTYFYTYEICEVGNATNCSTATVEIEVTATTIAAEDDGLFTFSGVAGGTTADTVLDNDTLNGVTLNDASLVTLAALSLPAPTSGSISLNSGGTVTVAPETTPGTYTLTYEICEAANSTNCATAQVSIEVTDSSSELIAEIKENLETILEEDLANTLLQQSNQISGYSADALDRLQGRSHDACLAAVNARLEAENILFDVDRAVIKRESYGMLDEIASILGSCPGSAFEIAGHTDSDASDAYNLDLSQRRVVAVLYALTERGVDSTGYVTRGYGESQPIASNATEAGKAQNRRVEFRALDTDRYDVPCDDGFSLSRALNANANDNGASVNGEFIRDAHDCITDRREVFEGSLSYLDTNTGQTQSAINLSYRREQYRGSNSVFGYFVGFYGTQSDVTNLADGDVRGFGLNAGVYGANRLQSDLFLDYYLGAAAGRHSFDLAFDRDIGTIDSSGDYQYLAGFAGVALSGQVELGQTTVTPRVGFDYVYAPATDVDVIAELGGLTDVGILELDAISGGRVFAEVRTEHSVLDGTANLWVNPRIACYKSLGSLDGVCGFGGSIGIASAEQDNGLSYAFEIDGEWGEDYSTGSLSMSVEREVGVGFFRGNAGVGSDGAMNFSGALEVEF